MYLCECLNGVNQQQIKRKKHLVLKQKPVTKKKN